MKNFNVKDLLYFDKMLTPTLAQFLYWIIAGLSVLAGVAMVLFSIIGLNIGGIIMGIVYIILGPLFIRIWFELVLVVFKIYEKIAKIADKE